MGDCDAGIGCGAGETDGETESRVSIIAMNLRRAVHQLQAKLQCRWMLNVTRDYFWWGGGW